ncbi:MAG: sigma-70 family RNA polymerase sigma factor [Planctomycetota bacterium]
MSIPWAPDLVLADAAESSTTPKPQIQHLVQSVLSRHENASTNLHRRLVEVFQRFWSTRCTDNPELAERLTADTVTEVMQALVSGRYDPTRASFLTFAYAVARRVGLRYGEWKARRREVELSNFSDSEIDDMRTQVPDLELAEMIDAMRSCLQADASAALSPDERYIILGLVHGKTIAQLSTNLAMSLDSVHRRKIRALEKLRKCMVKKGFP